MVGLHRYIKFLYETDETETLTPQGNILQNQVIIRELGSSLEKTIHTFMPTVVYLHASPEIYRKS